MWQFESSFPYRETPDQLRAIAQTKADMESGRPMDRLICGDVGFGKTEVAIRAAFKCVTGGRQAAILAPTTVLAAQHYRTFRTRMSEYPVRIELMSRFTPAKKIKEIVAGIADGSVDIVIGTHRVISKDITFKNLGLVSAAALAELLLAAGEAERALKVIRSADFPAELARAEAILETRALEQTGRLAESQRRWQRYLASKKGDRRSWISN